MIMENIDKCGENKYPPPHTLVETEVHQKQMASSQRVPASHKRVPAIAVRENEGHNLLRFFNDSN